MTTKARGKIDAYFRAELNNFFASHIFFQNKGIEQRIFFFVAILTMRHFPLAAFGI